MSDDDNSFGFGKSAPINMPRVIKGGGGKSVAVRPEILDTYKEKAVAALAACATKRDVLEVEVDSLSQCVALAAEIYKDDPVPDNAYQLSALTNAHNSALSQLEKMKDPQAILEDLEKHIRNMFTSLVQALVGEIHKTKTEFVRLYPDDKPTIEDQFSRMMEAIQPQTGALYDDLQKVLKNILGIKIKKDEK